MAEKEYIERETVVELFNKWADGYSYIEVPTKDAIACVRAIPAADVRPVVRSHLTDHRTIEHDGEWYCSNCGNEVTICMCGKDKTWDYPYCPNCGAYMRPTSMSGTNGEES